MNAQKTQNDRAAGVLLTQAVGDALGVPYEFATPPSGEPQMLGGGLGNYEPGEWSDDTQMAVCIAEVSATGVTLDSREGLDAVAEQFLRWHASNPADIGIQTSRVLGGARQGTGSPTDGLTAAARDLHEQTSRTAGNGALMRTGIVGLSLVTDREATARAARAVAGLTHADPLAGDSCVLWSEAVRVAVTEARIDLAGGLDLLPAERREQWTSWIAEAETQSPKSFRNNGFTVVALQAAWSAITHTVVDSDGPEHVRAALTAAVQIGNDTDTVAAIAGALLGARYGASAIPFEWSRLVHGWPGLRAGELIALASRTHRGGEDDPQGWPTIAALDYGKQRRLATPHPHDDQVLLGTVADLEHLEELGVDAVVSLCRLGSVQGKLEGIVPQDHATYWLIDNDDPAHNQHLDWVLTDAARAVRQLRSEGKRVLLHCVAAQHRTPSIALRYAQLLGHDGPETAEAIAAAVGYDPTGLLWQTALRATAGDATTAAS